MGLLGLGTKFLGVSLTLPGVLVLLIWFIPWETEVSYSFDCEAGPRPQGSGELDEPDWRRTIHNFSSSDTTCEGWLYRPKRSRLCCSPDDPVECAATLDCSLPVVIMAHGLGAQKDFGLHKFASTFVADGLAVFVFDFRTFGGSDGEPRHWVSPTRHVEDWTAALTHVTGGGLGGGYDPSRVLLWGTSYSGGHAIVTAATAPAAAAAAVQGVIALVPHLDGKAASKASLRRRGVLSAVRLLAAGLHDALREWAGASAAYVPIVGPPGSLGVMQLVEEEAHAYFEKHPRHKLGGWQPKIRARFALEASAYSPIAHVAAVRAPLLLLASTTDSLCPLAAVLAAKRARKVAGLPVTVRAYDANHFALYLEPHYSQLADDMTAFTRGVLPGRRAGGTR